MALSHPISEWCHPLLPLFLSSLQPKMDTQLPATFPSPPHHQGDLSKNIYDHVTPLFQTFHGSHCCSDNVETPDGFDRSRLPLSRWLLCGSCSRPRSFPLSLWHVASFHFLPILDLLLRLFPNPVLFLTLPAVPNNPLPAHPAALLLSQPAPVIHPDPFLRAPRRLRWALQPLVWCLSWSLAG